MIDRLYLDLAEETSDLKIYGKLLQACKAAAEELFRTDRVNELYRDLRVRMKNNFFFQSYREKQRYESGSRFAKEPCALLQYQILIPSDLVIIP